MLQQSVPLQTEKMANDNAYKRLAQLYRIMKTPLTNMQLIITEILQDYVNIDYELPASVLFQLNMPELLNSTALELAAKERNIKVFNILMQQGADFTRKNERGSTVLHQTIDSTVYSDNSMYPWQLRNQFTDSILDAHIKSFNSSNPQNKHGLSHFHIACMTNHVEAVKFFLQMGVSPNQAISNESTIFPGFTPLHLAAKFCALNVLQLLLQTNVKIDAKNANSMSPLELLIQENMCMWEDWRRVVKSEFGFHINLDANRKMMDMIMKIIDPQTQLVDEATGLSRFHIACTTTDWQTVREQLKLVNNLQHSVNESSTLWPGYTALHFAAHHDFKVFEMLLDAGADLQAMDSKGQTPFDICLRNFKLNDIEAILRRTNVWANVRFSNEKATLLDFIVALKNPGRFEVFLNFSIVDVNARIPEDSSLCRGYTPLHLAVLCCERLRCNSNIMTNRYRFCLDACLRLGADVTTKNSQGSTPLHLAFHLKDVTLMKMLLDGQTSADNPRDNTGLSHLHIASLANHPSLVRRLPRCSKDLEAPIRIHDFYWEKSSRIRNGATPLSIALSVDARETVEALVERGARIPVDEVERFAKMDVAVGLLSRLHPLDVEGVLRHCEPKTLIAEMLVNAQLRDYLVERRWLTRLHVAVLIGEDIDELTDDVNATAPLDSPVWPGCTALHLLMVGRRFKEAIRVAQLLLDRGANTTVKNARGATPVHDAFDWFMRDVDITSLFDTLLRQSDVNPVDSRGISHFHLAAMFNRVDVVKELLRNNVDVDGKIDEFSNAFSGLTALHLAVIFGCDEVVKTLLAHGADVHCEDVVGNRPMHVAASTGIAPEIEGIVRSLMSAGAEINVKNLFGETPIEMLLKLATVEIKKVKLFLEYGCKVNVVNPVSNQGILALALTLKDKSIFKCLLNVYDHSELDECGRSAMHNVVMLNLSFHDLPKTIIDKQFTDYVRAIQKLTGIDLDIDFQDTLGKTPLHLTVLKQNISGVKALLKCGADININDTKGLPPIFAAMSRDLNGTSVTRLDTEILEYFSMHIRKLCFFKLHVNDFNLEAERQIQRKTWLEEPVIYNCNVEIESMVKKKIGAIALRDFLSETGVVAAYPTMLYDLRSSIDEYFKMNVDLLLKEFPELSCLLILQYTKARKRLNLSESYAAALKYLVKFEIPHLCTDRIFRFLTFDDLKNLISSASFE